MMFGYLTTLTLSLAMLTSPIAADGRAERTGTVPVASIVSLSAEHDGATVHLRAGELLQVALAANPSTGYSWNVETLNTRVVLRHCAGYVPDLPQMAGSGGTARLFFEAFQPGRTELHLAYYRQWEGPSTAIDSFTVHLVVH